MKNYSKGPYHSNGNEIRDYKGMIIGHAYKHLESNMSSKEVLANAKLIAAAPNLYEAVELLLYGIENGIVHGIDDPCKCQICIAKQALKKATGNTE